MTLEELKAWHIAQQRLNMAKVNAHYGTKPSYAKWRAQADFHGNAVNAILNHDIEVYRELQKDSEKTPLVS